MLVLIQSAQFNVNLRRPFWRKVCSRHSDVQTEVIVRSVIWERADPASDWKEVLYRDNGKCNEIYVSGSAIGPRQHITTRTHPYWPVRQFIPYLREKDWIIGKKRYVCEINVGFFSIKGLWQLVLQFFNLCSCSLWLSLLVNILSHKENFTSVSYAFVNFRQRTCVMSGIIPNRLHSLYDEASLPPAIQDWSLRPLQTRKHCCGSGICEFQCSQIDQNVPLFARVP